MAGGISLLFFDFATKAATASSASNHFGWLMHEWRQLWWSQHEDGVIDRIKVIEAQMLVAVDVDVSVDEKLNLECDERAEEIIRAEYGEFAV